MQRSTSARSDPAVERDEYLCRLGERVREERARRGMTRRILARDSGLSERYLAQLESGKGNLSIKLLRRVGEALNLPLPRLLGGEPAEPAESGTDRRPFATPAAGPARRGAGIARRALRCARRSGAATAHSADWAARRRQIDLGQSFGRSSRRAVHRARCRDRAGFRALAWRNLRPLRSICLPPFRAPRVGRRARPPPGICAGGWAAASSPRRKPMTSSSRAALRSGSGPRPRSI